MDFLVALLYLVPLSILVACIAWFVRFITSQQDRDRVPIKWKQLGLPTKAIGVLLVVWSFFNLYLAVDDELQLLGVTTLPLSTLFSVYHPLGTWMLTSVIVGLAFLLRIRYPKNRGLSTV